MAVKSTFSIVKIFTFLFLFLSIALKSHADELLERLIYVPVNNQISSFNTLSNIEQAHWIEQHQLNADEHSTSSYLLAATYFYKNKKYKQADTQIKLLLISLSKAPKSLLLANATYLKAFNTSLGLRNFDDAVAIFQETIGILNTLEMPQYKQQIEKLAIAANYRLGSLYLFLNEPNKAKIYLEKSATIAKSINNMQYLVSPTLELAKYYMTIDNTEMAEQQLIESFDIALASKSERRPHVLEQLSRYYRKNYRFELAIDYAIKAVKYYKDNDNKISKLAAAYNNLAIAYEESGDLNTALVHYLNTTKLLEDNPHNYFLALATHNSGLIYEKQAKFELAVGYLKRANISFKAMGHGYFLMASNLSLAKIQVSRQHYTQAINYGEAALTSARKLQKHEVKREALGYLSEAYFETKQFAQAATAYNEWAALEKAYQTSLEEKIESPNKQPPVSENAGLRTQLSDIQSQLNEQKFNNAQQENNLATLKIALAVVTSFFIIIILILKRTKAEKKRLRTSVNIHNSTNLVTLHDEQLLLKIFNEHFIGHQYLFVIQIPLLNQLINLMGLDKANELKSHLTRGLSQFIGQPLYQISEDTFVFSKTPSSEQSVALRFAALLEQYSLLVPSKLSNIPLSKSLILGAVQLNHTDTNVNLIQAKNMINLSLTALSAVRENISEVPQKNWLILKEKDEQSAATFTCATRKEWLYLAHNHMLTVTTGLPADIAWLTVPHFEK